VLSNCQLVVLRFYIYRSDQEKEFLKSFGGNIPEAAKKLNEYDKYHPTAVSPDGSITSSVSPSDCFRTQT